ncbi:MAG: hypothetical protein IAE65_09170 [Ignavibacteria bacterium]|nr:hypothetical protein [Ignavibacteria bacterium]HCN37351.1 hypothetical protein [Bacteroidota bacterium]
MKNNLFDSNKDNINYLKEVEMSALDNLYNKVRQLINKLNSVKDENNSLLNTNRELTIKINDLKLQLTKLNSSLVLKEKEISEIKSLLLQNSSSNSYYSQDKDVIKSRIKELISRIDVHLDSYEGRGEYDE